MFWLYTPCESPRHVHGYVGPFKGDPRIVLNPELDDRNQRSAPPDPFVGMYTAFRGTAYLIEHEDYQHAIAIVKKGAYYEINIEPGLRLQASYPFGLAPTEDERGVIVRWIVADLPYDGLRLQDWRFSPGFALVPGVGPATFGATDPVTGENRTGDWSHKSVATKVEAIKGEAIVGVLSHKGKPIGMARPGSLVITPIGKFMYFGETGYRSSGWRKEVKGEPLFKEDGSLTQAGRKSRHLLKKYSRRTEPPTLPRESKKDEA